MNDLLIVLLGVLMFFCVIGIVIYETDWIEVIVENTTADVVCNVGEPCIISDEQIANAKNGTVVVEIYY